MALDRDTLLTLYFERGWNLVPLREHTKAPYHDQWPERDFRASDFGPSDNIGLQLREQWLDVDLDCNEAIVVADTFLEATSTWGHASKPRSHWLYRLAPSDVQRKALVIEDPDAPGHALVEVRTDREHQTMLPGSTWHDKIGEKPDEPVEWTGDQLDTFTEFSFETIKRRAILLAACAYLVRHYPEGGTRHQVGLPLCGMLRMLDVKHEEARWIIEAASNAMDGDTGTRLGELNTTYRLEESAAMEGFSALRKLCPKLALGLKKILGGVFTRDGFNMGNSGTPTICRKNIELALAKEEATFQLNLFGNREEFINGTGLPIVVDDYLFNHLRLEIDRKHRFLPSVELFESCLKDLAYANSYHPVQMYLHDLPPWDAVQRVDTWLSHYLGAEDTAYTRAVGRKVLIAAVRRVLEPGIKFDNLLVLESPQGTGKSSAIAALCPSYDWFTDHLPLGADPQRVIEQTAEKWIVEISELYGLRDKQIEAVKAFLSRQKDEARAAYGKKVSLRKRSFICIGTTNRDRYLADPTGNRRFWPVTVGSRQNVEGIARDRDQLWAEAFTHREEPLVLPEELWPVAVSHQEEREEEDPWVDVIRTTMRFPDNPKNLITFTYKELFELLGVPIERQTKRETERLRNIMFKKFQGWRWTTKLVEGHVVRCFGRELTAEEFKLRTMFPDLVEKPKEY